MEINIGMIVHLDINKLIDGVCSIHKDQLRYIISHLFKLWSKKINYVQSNLNCISPLPKKINPKIIENSLLSLSYLFSLLLSKLLEASYLVLFLLLVTQFICSQIWLVLSLHLFLYGILVRDLPKE